MRFIASATVPRARDLVAVGLERRLQKAQDRRLVVDHEDAHLARHAGCLARAET